jgi:hypothetical protein
LNAEALTPFALDRPPLLRAKLLRLDRREQILLISLHHLVADGLTLKVLMQELNASYSACCLNRTPELPPLPIQYKDFAVWQQRQLTGKEMRAHGAYWMEKLGGDLPVLALPTDRPRPAQQTFAGGQILRRLPASGRDALRGRCQQYGVTLFMLLIAALNILLHQVTGQDDILIGTPVAGRARPELEGQVGYYLNNVVLRETVRRGESFTTLLLRVRETVTEALAHQDYPFDLLIEALAIGPTPGRSPLFDVQLNLVPGETSAMQMGELTVSSYSAKSRTTVFDLNFMLGDGPLGLATEIGYSTALFDAMTIERLGDRWMKLLTAIGEQPESTVRSLCRLMEENHGAAERAEFLAAALNLSEEF